MGTVCANIYSRGFLTRAFVVLGGQGGRGTGGALKRRWFEGDVMRAAGDAVRDTAQLPVRCCCSKEEKPTI